tara:strand:+ start:5 stop:1291 length:1287 start_codon:yes stop_codon:yes gene_type:complete
MSSEIKVDTISENTSANGVSIDGVTLKDNAVLTDSISEKTSANGVVIDSVTLKDGGITATTATFNDGVAINIDDNSDGLTITSTDADATNGPGLRLFRNSASPADSDDIGRIIFSGENDASEQINYGIIRGDLLDVTDGTEDGIIKFETIVAGTNREIARFGNGVGAVFNEDSISALDFRIESDGNSHMLFVDASNNNILINNNTDRLSAELQVTGVQHNARVATFTHTGDSSSVSPFGILIEYSGSAPDNNSDTASQAIRFFDSSGSTRFLVASDGDCLNHDNDFGAVSDERLKDNIVDASTQWDDIKSLKIRKFERKDDIAQHGQGNNVQIGVIAQELEAAGMNGLVKESDPGEEHIKMSSEFGTLYEEGDSIPEDKKVGDIKTTTSEKVRSVKYSVLYMKAIKALQEAMSRIETLEAEVTALKGE